MNTLVTPRPSTLLLGSGVLLLALVVSGWSPFDRATWILEVLPVLIGWPILLATHRRFPLTSLVYGLVLVHALILILGGAYSYARVPLGFQLQEWFHLDRNPYDKIGHLAQGFIPVMVARELFLRGGYVRGKKMTVYLLLSVVLGISALYELIEWAAALAMGQGADEFLGTQGDQWDTQSDMFCALLGASAALALLSRWHDRQLGKLP